MPLIPARISWLLVLACAAAYGAAFLIISPALFQDLPNHLARVVVLDDLIFHGGSQFGDYFRYHPVFAPYILCDFAWIGAIELFGVRAGTAICTTLVLFSVPVAIYAYMRYLRVDVDRQTPILILSLYLATGAFFLWGFLSFCLGCAAVIGAFTAAQMFRDRATALRYGSYLLLVVVAFLAHLAALLFIGAAVGATALERLRRRTTSLLNEALLVVPPAALLVFQHFSAERLRLPTDAPSSHYSWGTPALKLVNLLWPFLRYHARVDVELMGGFVICLALLICAGRRSFRGWRASPELPLLVLVFSAMYLVLPDKMRDAEHIDVRALAPAGLFLLLAIAQLGSRAVRAGEESGAREPGGASEAGGTRAGNLSAYLSGAALAVAFALAFANLWEVSLRLHRFDGWLRQYRAAIAAVPQGASALPIVTRVRKGMIRPEVHSGSFLVTDRRARMPYLFSAEQGHPMVFFRYVRRPYAPDVGWYTDEEPPFIDWPQIACTYRYIVVTLPYQPSRIAVTTSKVGGNTAADVLAIDPAACQRRVSTASAAKRPAS